MFSPHCHHQHTDGCLGLTTGCAVPMALRYWSPSWPFHVNSTPVSSSSGLESAPSTVTQGSPQSPQRPYPKAWEHQGRSIELKAGGLHDWGSPVGVVSPTCCRVSKPASRPVMCLVL